jgi:preprotein translocase subunit SecD
MKTKLHLGILIVLMTFLGRYLETAIVPNQQIVVQFSDKDIAKEDAVNAIDVVREQLQGIGVAHLQIVHNGDGQLKITYYSESDVTQIQDILLKEEGFNIAYDSGDNSSDKLPENKNVKDYELNISEIQNSNDSNWDFERTEVVELNQKSDSSYNPKVKSSGAQINKKDSNNKVSVAVQVNNFVANATNHISYKIPEVRAGPTTNGII